MIDLSKAFDTIPHHLLLNKLKSTNLSMEAVLWFSSYLSNRKQRAVVDNHIAPFKDINRGVPQGSCLSPLLFNLFVNDLPKQVHSDVIQFADDITETEHAPLLSTVKQNLVESFLQTEQYCKELGLSINVSKTQFIIFNAINKKYDDCPTIQIHNDELTALKTVKLLGFTLDKYLTFGAHIEEVVNKSRSYMGILRKFSKTLPSRVLLLMYTALIRSQLEYCSTVFQGVAATNLKKLDTIQKIAARIICGLPNDAHAEPILNHLHLDALKDRRSRRTMNLVLDTINGGQFSPLANLFAMDNSAKLVIPKWKSLPGKRRFSIIASSLFNENQLLLT